MKQYNVTGMSCAACAARIEKSVSKVQGVDTVSVSLLTNCMAVEGSASAEDIIQAVEKAGYGAEEKGIKKDKSTSPGKNDDYLKDRETPVLKKKLITSAAFLAVLMYISMGYTMFSFPMPEFFAINPVAVGILELLLTIIIMIINKKFFISGLKAVIHKSPNMDTLVALGSFVSFGWSVIVLFQMTGFVSEGNLEMAQHLLHQLYFESAAMILTLITIGKMLEAHSKGKTTSALSALMKLNPETATLLEQNDDGSQSEVTVNIENVKAGDIFIVKPGENIPVDGIVISGSSGVNESALTGESIPVDKYEGSQVSAATTNISGFITCKATRVGEDTTLSQIIQMVSDAAATKAPIAKLSDKVSGIFVPLVMAIAALTFAVWLIIGAPIGEALERGISVLVISCPCALGLATPVAIMVSSGMGAKHGILFKTAAALEATGKINAIAIDKTGTITSGVPSVTDIFANEDGEAARLELLRAAYHLEKMSEHPLGKAVVNYAEGVENIKNDTTLEMTDFKAVAGSGVTGVCNGVQYCGGNEKFVEQFAEIPDNIREMVSKLSMEGKTPLLFSKGSKLLGVIWVRDTLRPDAEKAVTSLKKMGIHTVMLTGDNKLTAGAIGRMCGVDEVISGVLPSRKAKYVEKLKEKYGSTAMVGDGINDAPALTTADIGIAIGAGTDVAIDAADVVLLNSRMEDVAAAVRLSRGTMVNIKENLFWAFFYNCIGIPLAAGAFISLLGLKMNPMFGAAAMSLSSFCVVTNALRLNFFDMYSSKHDHHLHKKSKKSINKEEKNMTKVVKVDGMMCSRCESHVKKALEAIDGISEAVCDHVKGTAVVTMTKDVDEALIRKAIEDEDYKYLGME